MSTQIQRRPNFLIRFYRSTIVKAFQKLISNPKAPEHGASYSSPYGVRQPFSPAVSMSAFAGHAYTHACATRASQDLAELPIKLIRGYGDDSERIWDHPFLALMNQPNTNSDGFLFREQLLIDLILSGNCYVLIVGNLKNPTSLFRLHPENVEVNTLPNRGIIGFKYTDGGVSVVYPVERVLQCRNASWNSGAGGELYGTGAIESLAREIDADINAQRLASETSRQGRPDILLSPKDDADIWGKERRREILDSYRRMTDSGGAMVLSGQIDVKPLNLSPREMEFEAARRMARENISAVIGVPGTILGLPDSNYATARQANLTYWQIQTKRGRKMEILFTRIAKLYDDRLRVDFDYSYVEALQDVRTEKLVRIEKHIMNGFSPAEAYAYEGLDDSPLRGERIKEEEIEVEEEERNYDTVLKLLETKKKSFLSEENKTDHWNSWVTKVLDPAEARFQRVSYTYLQDSKRRLLQRAETIISTSRTYESDITKAIGWVELFARAAEIKFIKNSIGRLMNDTWIITGNDTISQIYEFLGMDTPADMMFGDQDLEEVEKAINEMAEEIVDTNLKYARKAVRDGIKDGLSNKEIADKLQELWVYDESHAKMIAQTEATRVINEATNQGYVKIEEEEEGIEVRKIWISSRDDKVRPGHQFLNDSILYGKEGIPATDYFRLGSDRALAPAGFSDAGNTINCRCTIAPILIEVDVND